MLKQDDICNIQSKTDAVNADYGDNRPTFPTQCSYTCDLQPYSGTLAYRDYGISDDSIRWRTFGQPNAYLINGNRLVFTSGNFTGQTFEIRYVRKWDNHNECLLKEVF